ncbi:hypothetical protein [Natronogracilivirga saccharolytica]|uniref:Uncharacterized protein n=1 Tax=Natronogracilivirga saccharolytica TaxID=2812953 RepID=A0A8J7UVS5_9BACT|nr:hypothetical protein [Natronogracilivirga saccharolytica]MBP3192856.1 hypothetical protein [Natronogracilivirga saccharolytica]
MYSFGDQNIWDEHDWESHINEMTRRHEKLRNLIETDHDKSPRWLEHLKNTPTKLDAVDAFIEEELLIEESHFPMDEEDMDEDEELFPDEEDEWEPDEENGDLFEEQGEGNDLYDDEEEENDHQDDDDIENLFEDIFEDEAAEASLYDYTSLENIAIYTDARDLSADLLVFSDSHPGYMSHPGFLGLVSDTLIISSKLAAAYSMGFDLEVLGANIAYCKKALARANEALEHLQRLKDDPLQASEYYDIHRRLFELRNNIAIHIQDTRRFFNSQL